MNEILQDLLARIGLKSSDTFVRSYCAGELMMQEGDPSTEFFIILNGSVNVIVNRGAKNESRIAELGELELLGEMTFFDKKRRSASAVAVTDTEVLVLDENNFSKIDELNSDFVNILIQTLACRIRNICRSNK